MNSRQHPTVLQLHGITCRFGDVTVVDNTDLLIRAGTVHALLGENGAGKTTLMRVAYGMHRAKAGEIRVDEHVVRIDSPLEAIRHGIGMVHQHFTLVPAMTVAENLALGGRGRLRAAEAIARVHDAAARTGFRIDPAARVETLSVGAQQRVEIAKALSRSARILILDEPTAMLAPTEVNELLQWLRAYADAGNAAVIITHKLREALAVADDVTVLRRGKVTHTGPTNETTMESLTMAMIGEGLLPSSDTPTSHPVTHTHIPVLLRAHQITVADHTGVTRLHDASFALHQGELLGVVGVEGAGHRELLRAVARRLPIAAGTLEGPATIGFIPEDRHRDAVLLDRSLTENVVLRGAGARQGLIDWRAEHDRTAAYVTAYDVRASDTRTDVRSLSGGNQQKLVVARELEVHPATSTSALATRVIVAENPTRGLDIRATASVHARLRAACTDGAGVIVYSSDLDEVLLLASRVLVLFDGRLRSIPANREMIARAMLGFS